MIVERRRELEGYRQALKDVYEYILYTTDGDVTQLDVLKMIHYMEAVDENKRVEIKAAYYQEKGEPLSDSGLVSMKGVF